MRRLLLACVLALAPAEAAVIRGNVVENYTGKALMAAVVVVQPVGGTPEQAVSQRTNKFGGFEFGHLPAGAYIVQVSRRGFMTMQYGQKKWNSAGSPVFVEEAAATFLIVRLARFSAITGTIVDENDIGLPGHEVIAYKKANPPQIASRATADDRGEFRIAGLDPGVYYVRSAGQQYEEGAYLPTFAKETDVVEQAQQVDAFFEGAAGGVVLRPKPGRLFSLTVNAAPVYGPVEMTLASDMGRITVKTPSFQFKGLPPGNYELYLEGEDCAAYARVPVLKDTSTLLSVMKLDDNTLSSLRIFGGPAEGAGQVLIRRKDEAGTLPIKVLKIVRNEAMIPPGRWELMLAPPSGYYVSAFSGPGVYRTTRDRPDGWNEVTLMGRAFLRFTLTAGPSSIRGMVKSAGDPVAGAPVFLEPYDDREHRRAGDLRAVRAGMRGEYRFDNLAPGTYRILSTFEYLNPDADAMDSARAESFTLSAHSDTTRDLELYGIR